MWVSIKLFAPPKEYFVKSIKHMVFFKYIIPVIMGFLVVGILFFSQRLYKFTRGDCLAKHNFGIIDSFKENKWYSEYEPEKYLINGR